MEILMEAKTKYTKKYKCIYCDKHYDREGLIKHIEKYHIDEIPEDYSPVRVVFDIINKKNHGNCVICKKETNWNPVLARYDRFCSKECKDKYTKIAKERMMRVYGKEHLLNEPDQQKKMLSNRGISGEYKMSSGGTLEYTGTYEKKTLEFMDKVLGYTVTDIQTPGPVIEYEYAGKKHFWITDIYIPAYELCIDVKDGGDNPNKRDMKVYREKQIAKEKAIIDQGKYNYLRLTNNNFTQLLSTLAELKMQLIDHNPEKIIRINENMFAGIGAMLPMENSKENNVYICNYMLNNIFANTCVSDDPYFENAFVITGDGIVREASIQNIIGSERVKYNIYKATTEDPNLFNKLHELATSKEVNEKSLLEIVFNKDMYSDDEWLCYENVTEIEDVFTYLYEIKRIVESSIKDTDNKSIDAIHDDTLQLVKIKEDINGYYLENSITGMRTPSQKDNRFSDIQRKIVTGGVFA